MKGKAKDPKSTKSAVKPVSNLKDFLPNTIKQPPRDGKPIPKGIFEQTHRDLFLKQSEFKSFGMPEEWPGDETASNFNFGLESNLMFNDKTSLQLPPSFTVASSQITLWRRPKDFMLEELTQEEKAKVAMDKMKANEEEEEEANEKDDVDSQKGIKKISNIRKSTVNRSIFANREKRRDSASLDPKDLNRSLMKRATVAQNIRKKMTKKGMMAMTLIVKKATDDAELDSPMRRRNIHFQDDDDKFEKKEDFAKRKLKIFGTQERLETSEEVEERKKREAEKAPTKDKKKAGKKNEEINIDPDQPRNIKEVKLSNLDLSAFLPFYSRWIASQLQLIKDRDVRDVNTGKPIWTRVYPQVDGIPVYNPSGRYWVKMYFMGRERKIEIDDRMPKSVSHTLFPRSEELWTMILTKAFCKLESYNWDSNLFEREVGDGSVLYSLTGYVPETLKLKNLTLEDWRFLNQMLNDFHYDKKSVVASVFCSATYKPYAPSNAAQNKSDFLLDTLGVGRKTIIDMDSSIIPKDINRSASKIPTHETKIESKDLKINVGRNLTNLQKERPTYVIPGFAYSILESFYNETFNMVYVKERSEAELKLRQDYLGLTKLNMHKMSKEEKLDYRRQKKDLKERLASEEKRRYDLITKAPLQYKFFRIKSCVAKVRLLQFLTPFTSKEILLAKKCVLNRLPKPPNYDMPDLKMDEKSVISQSIQQVGGMGKDKDKGEDSFINKPLDEFNMPNIIEIMTRSPGGAWLMDRDLCTAFEYVQLFYDMKKLKFSEQITVPTCVELDLTSNEGYEILVVERCEEFDTQQEISNDFSLLTKNAVVPPSYAPKGMIPFIFSFSAMRAMNTTILPSPSCILQKFNFDKWECLQAFKTLCEPSIDTLHFYLENKNQVFRVQANSPLGYSIWCASDNKFQFMSLQDYLIKYEGYTNRVFPVEHTSVEKNKYYMFAKLKLILKEIVEGDCFYMLVRIRPAANGDLLALKYLQMKLFYIPEGNECQMLQDIEGVQKNLNETSFTNALDFNRIKLDKLGRYILLVEGMPVYTMNDGNFEIEILHKKIGEPIESGEATGIVTISGLTVEPIDVIEPVQEYLDKYNPTKYGLLFRERLFVGEETFSSIYVRITNMIGTVPAIAQKTSPKKGGPEHVDLQESELTEKRLLYLSLYEEDNKVLEAQGYNSALLSNIVLNPAQKNYFLQAEFDLREWAECKYVNEDTKSLHWILRVFTSDTLAVIRDTTKEDYERSIRKGWEEKEPGRAEKAKKSRRKFQALMKKERGEALDEQEMELLNEQKLSKKQREDEQSNLATKKGGKVPPIKGMDKKAPQKGVKKEEVVEEKKEERAFPKSEEHTMFEVREFLEKMEQERLKEVYPVHSGLINTR